MKLINETQHLFFFFFLCGTVRIGQFGWVSLFFLFFCIFKFGYPHTVLPGVLHACTHNKFFFFFWVLLYNHNNVCVLCVCGLYVVCLCVMSVFVFGWCVCVLGWACCILFGLDFFKAQKLWMDFEVIHYSTWAWASHITQVSILELKLGKKQFKKFLKII